MLVLTLFWSIAQSVVCVAGDAAIVGGVSVVSRPTGTNVILADEDQEQFRHCPAAIDDDVKESGTMINDTPLLHIKNSTRSHKNDEDDGAVTYTKTWIPGYPGSGSAMLITIIEALTGLEAAFAYHDDNCISNTAISCKTHFPLHYPALRQGWWDDKIHSSVPFSGSYFLLLRNPAHSIPSFFNWKWEHKNFVGSHTTQSPMEDWREYRNKHLLSQIKNWVNTIRTWDESPLKLSLYLPFERLVNPAKGPVLVQHIATEFAMANSMSLSDDPTLLDVDMVPCLWKELVMDHPSKKRSSTYVPGFTTEQKEIMLHALEDLMDWAVDLPADITGTRLVDILDGYHAAISSGLVLDD